VNESSAGRLAGLAAAVALATVRPKVNYLKWAAIAAVLVVSACAPSPTPQIIYVTPAPTPTALPTSAPRIRPTLPPTSDECDAAITDRLMDALYPSLPPTMTQRDREIMPFCEAQLAPYLSPSP
jgi:hypothetical protein